MTTPTRRPCLSHARLSVNIKLDDWVISASRAEVAIVCLDCGTQTVRSEGVPVTVTSKHSPN